VLLSCEPGTIRERGPEIRTQTIRTRIDSPGRGVLQESHRVGGTVRTADGAPQPDAWVVIRETQAWNVTDHDGRFRFDHMPAGTYQVSARTTDGGEAAGEMVVPGRGVDLVIDTSPKRRKTGTRS